MEAEGEVSKYGNKKITIDGITFDSMLEGAFYQKLKALKQAGKIEHIRMHVPVKLHGHNAVEICTYKVDFMIWLPNSGYELPRAIEVKGYWTAVAKLKRKLFEAEYGKLEIHTKDKPWSLEPNIVASQAADSRGRSQRTNAPGAVEAAQGSHGGGKIPAADKNA